MPLPPMCGRPGVNVKRQLRGYQTTQLCSWRLATTSTHLRLMPRCVRPKKIIPHYPTGHNSEAGPAFVPIGNFLQFFAKNVPYVPYYVTLPGLVVQGNSLYRGLCLSRPQKWFEAPQRAWLRLEKTFFFRGFSGCHKYVAPGNETKIFLPHICGTRRYWVNPLGLGCIPFPCHSYGLAALSG